MNIASVLDGITLPLIEAQSKETSAVAEAVVEGLSARQKHLPCWLFYDAAGSLLFEKITQLPEYYLTSREHAIFSLHASEMIAAAAGMSQEPLSVMELGAGSASKTLILLRTLTARQGETLYLPVDVSEEALRLAQKNIHAALPRVEVQPICSEFTHQTSLNLPAGGRRLALYIGSSIGNFCPEDAVALLRWLRSELQPGDALLLGTDMVKDPEAMLAAYNDDAGITADFNKNVLARLNRELGADFVLNAFEHRAIWNDLESRIEMHLDSKRNQMVQVESLHRTFGFKRGESIHTENCYKFTPASVEDLLLQSGYTLEQTWHDNDHWFGVHLARVIESEIMPNDGEEAA